MNKFNAKKVKIFGEEFDSRAEGQHWLYLRDLEMKGKIKNLRRQVKFELTPADPKAGLRSMSYVADFAYEENGKTVIEDVKGYKAGAAWDLYNAKKKMLYYRYGILIREV